MIDSYRFAAAPSHARMVMRFYAAMFSDGPVLDLGAGRGFFLEALRERSIEGVGVDISQESATEARRLGVEVIVEDAFPFLESHSGYRGMFVSHLIEHMPPDRAQELMRLTYRALEPGGRIVVVTPNPADWSVMSRIFWLDPTHVRPYPVELVAEMLAGAGFDVEASGLGPRAPGLRHRAHTLLNRPRYGPQYGRTETWVRARR